VWTPAGGAAVWYSKVSAEMRVMADPGEGASYASGLVSISTRSPLFMPWAVLSTSALLLGSTALMRYANVVAVGAGVARTLKSPLKAFGDAPSMRTVVPALSPCAAPVSTVTIDVPGLDVSSAADIEITPTVGYAPTSAGLTFVVLKGVLESSFEVPSQVPEAALRHVYRLRVDWSAA